MRLLLLIVAIVAVFLAVRTLVRSTSARKESVSRDTRPERLKEGGAVIRCAYCGVHVPEAEAYRDGDRLYCSPQHAEVDRNRQNAGPGSDSGAD
ncbi:MULTISPECIES: PP0621 family protein [unclassified Thioalkalivibrio]|uniref:PP0621 family protein n=1 Tax=unclassified Thioalkalivibrio TaxID=2621013 RepID=UPI00036EEDE0|nr:MULTISPECIES: PP0621 family protein [unclassified Thioalkalivibrio]